MIKRLRATRFDRAVLGIVLDLDARQLQIEIVGLADVEADRLEAVAMQFARDGNVREALIALRALGFVLWLEIDEATMQFLIREALV